MTLSTSAEFDVLVNNAGQSRRGNILDATSELRGTEVAGFAIDLGGFRSPHRMCAIRGGL